MRLVAGTFHLLLLGPCLNGRIIYLFNSLFNFTEGLWAGDGSSPYLWQLLRTSIVEGEAGDKKRAAALLLPVLQVLLCVCVVPHLWPWTRDSRHMILHGTHAHVYCCAVFCAVVARAGNPRHGEVRRRVSSTFCAPLGVLGRLLTKCQRCGISYAGFIFLGI